jgi:flagellar biosynthetic protein FliO
LVLGAVCGLAYFILKWGVRRLVGVSSEEGGLVELVERRNISPDGAVVVVRVAERRLVLGESDAGIEMLTELVGVEGSEPEVKTKGMARLEEQPDDIPDEL